MSKKWHLDINIKNINAARNIARTSGIYYTRQKACASLWSTKIQIVIDELALRIQLKSQTSHTALVMYQH